MGTLQPKQLFFGSTSSSVLTYTVSNSTGSYAILKNINICANDIQTVVFNMHVVNEGGVASSNNKIIHNVVVIPGQTLTYDTSIVLEAGQSIHANASNGQSFSMLLSGVEYTP